MTRLPEQQQAAIAHDLPIITDLMGHHAIILAAAFYGSEQIKNKNIAWRAKRIFKEMKALKKQMKALSENEYPGAAWLSHYDRSAEKEK